MTRRPRPSVPNDFAVIGRAADGAFFVRDTLTGDVHTEREVGRELTDYEKHVCEQEVRT